MKEKPAILYSAKPKRLDSSTKTYEGIKLAKERDITFEQVLLTIGAGQQVISLSLGELKIEAEFIEKTLAHLQSLVDPNAPVVMQFKKLHTKTGT